MLITLRVLATLHLIFDNCEHRWILSCSLNSEYRKHNRHLTGPWHWPPTCATTYFVSFNISWKLPNAQLEILKGADLCHLSFCKVSWCKCDRIDAKWCIMKVLKMWTSGNVKQAALSWATTCWAWQNCASKTCPKKRHWQAVLRHNYYNTKWTFLGAMPIKPMKIRIKSRCISI